MADYKNEFGVFAERPKVPKKIYDAKYVVAGLVLFFVLATCALWPNLGKTVPVPQPKLDTPVIQKLAEKDRKCILPTPEMRATHMQMLIDWRENVVRSKEQQVTTSRGREFVAPDGKKYLASLTNTCMECHSNKVEFCDQCHNYAAVVPNCWGCHLEKGKKLAEAK
jgi:cytochrome c553